MSLRCYGENSATFLIFKALSDSDEGTGIRSLLLSLRRAGTGQPISETLVPNAVPEVWLFPNFGKRYGFGEPDVLILIGGHSFWFEVETRVNLGTRRTAARHSLLQLARFVLLHDALKRGAQVRLTGIPHLAYFGPTATDSGSVRSAILRKAGHPVLKKHSQRLADSIPHYAIMSIRQAVGAGGVKRDFGIDLGILATDTFTQLPLLPLEWLAEPIWYTYWRRNALDKCFPDGPDPLEEGGWVDPTH